MRANWLAAAGELRLPVTDDFNGDHPLGFGCYQITVRNGRRLSAADAFLRPALHRPNLQLMTRAWTSRIRFESRRAVGVDYVRGGQKLQANASREVLICAGTVNSPQLLQLSRNRRSLTVERAWHYPAARQSRRWRPSSGSSGGGLFL